MHVWALATCLTTKIAGPKIPTARYVSQRNSPEQAIEKDPKEPQAQCVTAWVAIFEKDLDRAKAAIDIALSLNPNLAFAHTILGTIQTFSGQPFEAIPEIERAMRLDPAFNSQYHPLPRHGVSSCRQVRNGSGVAKAADRPAPETDFSRAVLTSALGHLGEVDEAGRVWRELIEINPNYSFTGHFGRQPFKRQEDVERIAEGLAESWIVERADCYVSTLIA